VDLATEIEGRLSAGTSDMIHHSEP